MAPLDFQKKYKEDVIEAFNQGVIDTLEYSFFIDRITLSEGKYQIYGTQIYRDNIGNEYFIPIDSTKSSVDISPEMVEKGFITKVDPKNRVLFVHAYKKNTNQGVAKVQVFIDNENVGETNDTGFFQMIIPREEQLLELKYQDVEKTTLLKNDNARDYSDLYFQFE